MIPAEVPCHCPADVTNPGQRVRQCDYETYAQSLIAEGHCTIRLPQSLVKSFWEIISCHSELSPDTKESFSFPERTDGFLPFGMERSRTTNRVDLCERYCYRHKYRMDHLQYAFSGSPLYEETTCYESGVSAIAERLLDAICIAFNAEYRIPIRDNSYLQFCAYSNQYRREDREYLQDRHEDGNLITLVKASCEGLVIYPDGVPRKVGTPEDEIIVFTGSLLTVLSDGRIPFMDHAVLNPSEGVSRSSLVYFVLPDLKSPYPRLTDKSPVHLEALANLLHQGFGNKPFSNKSSPLS